MTFKIGLLAYEESETHIPNQDDIDDIGSADIVDNTDEFQTNVEANLDTLEVAAEELHRLERVYKTMSSSSKALSPTAAQIAFVSVEDIMNKLGMKMEQEFVSIEHFSDANTALQASQLSTEAVMETMKDVVKRIVDFIKMIWKKLSDFISESFNKIEIERKRRAQRVIDEHIEQMEKNAPTVEVVSRELVEAFFTDETTIHPKQILEIAKNVEKLSAFLNKTILYFDDTLKGLEMSVNELNVILQDFLRLNGSGSDLIGNMSRFQNLCNKAHADFRSNLRSITDESKTSALARGAAERGTMDLHCSLPLPNSKTVCFFTDKEFEGNGWAPIWQSTVITDKVDQGKSESATIVYENPKRNLTELKKVSDGLVDCIKTLAEKHASDFDQRTKKLIEKLERIANYFKDTANFGIGPNSPRQPNYEMAVEVLNERIRYLRSFVTSYSKVYVNGINLLNSSHTVTQKLITTVCKHAKVNEENLTKK